MSDKKVYCYWGKNRGSKYYAFFVYESANRKNTTGHILDFWDAVRDWNKRHGGKLDPDTDHTRFVRRYRKYKIYKNFWYEWVFILNKKNRDDWCFDDPGRLVIDLRK